MGYLRPTYALARFLGVGVGNNGDGAGRDCFVDELVAITGFSPHGNEEVPLLDSTRVII